jgi:hypothetical protein
MAFLKKLLAARPGAGGGAGSGDPRDGAGAFALASGGRPNAPAPVALSPDAGPQYRAVDARLAKYEAALVRELKRWEAMPASRADALTKARGAGRDKLLLLYSWGLTDLMETFRKQVRARESGGRGGWGWRRVAGACSRRLRRHIITH